MSKKFYNNGIECHLFEENSQPEGWIYGKLTYSNLLDINFNDIVSYYITHAVDEVCKKFKINRHQLKAICDSLNYKKEQKDIVAVRTRRNNEKYGADNVFQLQTVIQASKETKIEKCGSLENAYQLRNQQTIKTLQELTGDATITNVFQLQDVKEKSIKTLSENFGNGDYTKARHVCALKGSDTKELLYGYRGVNQTPEVEHKKRKRYYYDEIQFDSSCELALWIYAKDHNEYIVRGKDVPSFKYIFNNVEHWYHPDFIYKQDIIEIKSKYQYYDNKLHCKYGNSKRTKEEIAEIDLLYEAKLQCMLENNVKIWIEENYKFAINYCILKYNSKKWYLQFKNLKED